MTERISKLAIMAAGVLGLALLAHLAFSRSVFLTSPTFLGGFILLEVLLAALWMYRRVFLPLLLLAFLFAGVDVPFAGVWTAGRWFFLITAALAGCFIVLKERRQQFGMFHVMAIFAILAALVSAAVSRYPGFALLKALSLLLLFTYAGTGARVAASGREARFASGLLAGTELLVAVIGVFYFVGFEIMGNPNSLGAVVGVLGAPVLLWGSLLESTPAVHARRLVLFGVAMYLVLLSQARAGLLAACVSCSLLCLLLRKYKLFSQGLLILLILVAAAAIFRPEALSNKVSGVTTSVLYKGKDPALGVLSSRETPWQTAMESIHQHFWFGSGFGTTDNGQDASAHYSYGRFSSSSNLTAENGSSYLAIFTWVGMLGVTPFALLLFAVLGKILRTCFWMVHTSNPSHPAIPLAMVALAGLIHAGFEDWLFACGYYLCVLFWPLAFVLVDVAPWAPLPSFTYSWRPWGAAPQPIRRIAPSR